VLTSTSAGLLLPLLKDAGQERTPFGQLVMTAAALAEVATIMMLSLLFSATSKTSAGRLASLVMFLALLAVIGLALGRVRNLTFLDKMLDRLEDRSAQLRVRAALTWPWPSPCSPAASASPPSSAHSPPGCWCGPST
jgi:Kef-type K+ transport system membrane component KefB